MRLDSGAKSHFIDFVEITSDLLLITITFYSVPRAGRNIPHVKKWVLLVENGKPLVPLWLCGSRWYMLVHCPMSSRDGRLLPACPGENPFQTSKLLIPSIQKHLVSTGEAWNMRFNCDCYSNVEPQVSWTCSGTRRDGQERKAQIRGSRTGCHSHHSTCTYRLESSSIKLKQSISACFLKIISSLTQKL